MRNVAQINAFIQQELLKKGLAEVTAVEAAQWLDRAGLLKDSAHHPGKRLRDLLRAKQIAGQWQDTNNRWYIRPLGNKALRTAASPR